MGMDGGAGAKEAAVAATAGLSLGEYTALHIAGAFSFEDGLELVTLRGRAMQEAADAIRLSDGAPGSGMVAIIGAEEDQVRALCDKARLGEVLVPANFNAPGQIVISGSTAACRRAVEFAADMGMRATALPVAGAFHSALMQPAADRLRKALTATTVHHPVCPVLSNVTGTPHEPTPGAPGAAAHAIEHSIRARLVEQLTHPVRWEQDCRWLAGEFGQKAEFHELAPGKTLAGLYRRIDKAVKVEAHDEPAA
jgi:[acyl-carrier-protein] S-malonyltransferase